MRKSKKIRVLRLETAVFREKSTDVTLEVRNFVQIRNIVEGNPIFRRKIPKQSGKLKFGGNSSLKLQTEQLGQENRPKSPSVSLKPKRPEDFLTLASDDYKSEILPVLTGFKPILLETLRKSSKNSISQNFGQNFREKMLKIVTPA
ncbi:uncharacterized protein CELE_C33C12.1 [Caenorhabditis elegans]|uniref:Uncharacterized protein n=1 Tax=Caenorhabditis elegans TaxID=6239 RepID=O16584_CAEEL|nr:Uncharacterized protein CELE_C33C12.1 [Caenorhabditis elegans]CCD66448.2 Uncharacterized protein CELE_C33C12.1 [Caenorhabditis elegans]